MTALYAQYGDPASSTFVTNFTVIYLRLDSNLINYICTRQKIGYDDTHARHQ